MSQYRGPKEQLDAARSVDTSVEELRTLARSEYNFVREAVAANPNTEVQILVELFPEDLQSGSNQYLAVALAQSSKTPAPELSKLVDMVLPFLQEWNSRGDSFLHFKIGVALCHNPHTPIDPISMLLQPQHSAKAFRKVVARETQREDVLHFLLIDRSEVVRKQAAHTLTHLREITSQV
ncbi:MAG TPA: hypothetical protein VKY74_27830 [Chloroflexia bacterium]|nr:hypothetical protein [Chloroflexia bacterium]